MKTLITMVIFLITFSVTKSQDTCAGMPVVIYEGQTYNTVQIGDQCWLTENLNVGTIINGSQNQTNNNIIEKYCYNDSTINCETYGGIYQWNEAMQYVTTQGAKGVCPTGWHIPTYVEFQTFREAVNNEGNSLKAIGQGTGGGSGTNTSGFSALLVGRRSDDGFFYYLGDYAIFWSSTDGNNAYSAYYINLYNNGSSISMGHNYKKVGFSIRCLKD